MKGADFVWDKERLDRFIAKPDEVVPGNNMKPYGGLTSAEDRARVIGYSWSRPRPIERLRRAADTTRKDIFAIKWKSWKV